MKPQVNATVVIGDWDDWYRILSDLEEYFNFSSVDVEFVRPDIASAASMDGLAADLAVQDRIARAEVKEYAADLVVRVGSSLEPVAKIRERIRLAKTKNMATIAAHSLLIAEHVARSSCALGDVIYCRGDKSYLDMKKAFNSLGNFQYPPRLIRVPEEFNAAETFLLDHLEGLLGREDGE